LISASTFKTANVLFKFLLKLGAFWLKQAIGHYLGQTVWVFIYSAHIGKDVRKLVKLHCMISMVLHAGCKAANLTASCNPLSCQKTEAEERKRCNQFTDCQSCTVSDRCYYNAQSSESCGLVPPTHSVV